MASNSTFRELSKQEHMKARLYGIWPKGFREYIYKSNNGHCTYCGIKMYFSKKDHPEYELMRKKGWYVSERQCFVIEHIVNDGPESLANKNLVPACRSCNSNKQNKKLTEVTNFTLVY